MRASTHPLKDVAESLRRLVLGARPEIREGIKWKSASFRAGEYFATINLSAKDRVRLILHLGAKVKASPTPVKVADPDRLLSWLGHDRAMVTFVTLEGVAAQGPSLQSIVRAWLEAV